MAQKGLSQIHLLLITIAVGFFVLFYYLFTQVSLGTYESWGILKPSGQNNQAGAEPETGIGTFQDNHLKIKFNYPKRLRIYSLEATKEDPMALVFLSKGPSHSAAYAIDCTMDNRIEVAGLCFEGQVSDIDIFIYEMGEKRREFFETQPRCNKSQLPGKTVLSCVSYGIDGKDTNYFKVFLEGRAVMIDIKAGKDPIDQEAIKIISESFEVIP